jgi:uncharacterized protein YfkK (UPF0435 family)
MKSKLMKEKIDFDEQKAIEVIKKFGLAENTLRVWKTRGGIPAKYLQEGYKPPTEASKADEIIEKRITNILKSGLLNATVVTELAGVPVQKFHDVARGGSSFSKEEITAIKGQLNRLRIEIAKTFEIKSFVSLNKLLNNPAFNLAVVMRGCTKTEYDRASRIKLKKIESSNLDYSIIKDYFIKTALQLSV